MHAFLKNFLVMIFILSPALILCGMILFSGKPKDQREREKVASTKADPADRP